MKDWGTYRKLYDHLEPAFERLSFAARAVSAEILRRCDRNGRIVPGDRLDDRLVADLCFHVRAHPGEDLWIREAVAVLITDGYLVFHEGHLTIRNFVKAQRSESADRMARKRQRDAEGDRSVTGPRDGSDVTSEHSERDGSDVTDEPSSRFVSSGLSGSEKPDQPDRSGSREPPRTVEEALKLPVSERAGFVLKDPAWYGQSWQPELWPEVIAVAEALAKAAGWPPLKLARYHRDSGVRAVVELYGAGYSVADLTAVAMALPRSKYWASDTSKGLSSLSPEVVRRALQDVPTSSGEVSPRVKKILERLGPEVSSAAR
jgi:hypothetical protein